jgi:hypothetical protein
MPASSIARLDGRAGNISTLIDDIERKADQGAFAGYRMCAQMMQIEVVKRAPFVSGNLKEAFASDDAIGRDDEGRWVYGLITPELAKKAYYWKWVEYGTKSKSRRVRGYRNPQTGRTYRRTMPAVQGRAPHPFFRPGVAAARAKFTVLVGMGIGTALQGSIPALRGQKGQVLSYEIGYVATYYHMKDRRE